MSKKRRHIRYVVEGMNIRAKTLFNTEVQVLDISTNGASFRSARRFQMGSEYTFKVEHEDRIISVKGVIVWTKLTGSRRISGEETMPIYTAGMAFSGVMADKAAEIEEFIAFKIKELRERKLGGVRIKLHGHETGLLSYLETCVVRDISLGGMRIETGRESSAGTIFPLELVLPENEEPLSFTGKVAFCNEIHGKTPRRFVSGVEFTEMSDEDSLRLRQFIETLPGSISAT